VEHQLTQLENCPVCNHHQFDFWRKAIDHNVSGDEFQIVKCRSCGFRFTNPRPTEETIGKYYKSENYISHSGTKKGVINKLYHLIRTRSIVKKERLITSLAAQKTVLDVGCGTADFLAHCHKKGWSVTGVEPDEPARNLAYTNHKLKIHDLKDLTKLPEASFDVITMWHVLEHVYHLNKDIEHLKNLLRPGGHLVIAVPNCSSHDADYYKEDWAALDLPIHLYHFTPNDIKQLSTNLGLQLVQILPMKYDAYYISMLSEKYRGGTILKGFWRGFISNMKAKNSKNTFSSQIYVLKK
jgi:2-polyprenyl-3-methyl-5-hydroxy-6-metoxy-1,4-benzoquinol methylase